MKVMTNLELEAALLAARLKQDICRALTVHEQSFYVNPQHYCLAVA